ncbi:hypothetical protein G6M86_28105 (plasmid) [Agrobacterium tumefaciens]|uniref:Uncharacterized protein n=1 Tax=Agrobacterium tumefaciens TaxID=358 RepID=A0AAJ4TDI8_AGRTU|nr:hypothetical protein G6M86_28105 [Agrobacterium tumefaciens]
MITNLDFRLGGELGLPKPYADKPAFEIITDAHDLVAAFTSRMIAFKYGEHEGFDELLSQYLFADAKRIEFSRRLELLDGNAVEAAKLIDELNYLIEVFVDPWLIKSEEACDDDG